MASHREQIISALCTKLTGNVGAGVGVYRSRATALTRADSPALVVRAEREEISKRNDDLSERALTVRIEVITRGDAPDSLADLVLVTAPAKILDDPNLGGLCLFIRELETHWLMAEADLDAGLTSMAYTIKLPYHR